MLHVAVRKNHVSIAGKEIRLAFLTSRQLGGAKTQRADEGLVHGALARTRRQKIGQVENGLHWGRGHFRWIEEAGVGRIDEPRQVWIRGDDHYFIAEAKQRLRHRMP